MDHTSAHNGDDMAPEDYQPARYPYPRFERTPDGDWRFEVGGVTFRADRDPSAPRGRDWSLWRLVGRSGAYDLVYPDLPSREAALVEAESMVELEERAVERAISDARARQDRRRRGLDPLGEG